MEGPASGTRRYEELPKEQDGNSTQQQLRRSRTQRILEYSSWTSSRSSQPHREAANRSHNLKRFVYLERVRTGSHRPAVGNPDENPKIRKHKICDPKIRNPKICNPKIRNLAVTKGSKRDRADEDGRKVRRQQEKKEEKGSN